MSQTNSDTTHDGWTYHVSVKNRPYTVEIDADRFVTCVYRVLRLDGTDRSTRKVIWDDRMTGATPMAAKAAIRLALGLNQRENRQNTRWEYDAKVSIIRKAIDGEGFSDVSLRLTSAILIGLSFAGYRIVKDEYDEAVQLA